MDLLFERMPRLARFMMLGIMCMFIAPFGMLIAKWATLQSFIEGGQILLGGNDSYVAMCHRCWMKKIREQEGQYEVEGY